MADQRIQFNEEMVGANHPVKQDTMNRLALIEHNSDGTHSRLTKVTDPWIDVRSEGVTGDGVTDDTANLATVLANARKIIFPAGTYLVSGDTLIGVSNQTLYFMPGAVLKLDTTVSSETILNYASKSNVQLINPTFDVNMASTISNIALKVDGSTNVRIVRPRIINSAVTRNWPTTAAYGYGIYLLGAWEDLSIEDIYASDVMYPVITEPSSAGNGLKVHRGRMEYLSGDGVEINVPTGSASDIDVSGITFYKLGSNSATRGFGVGMSGGVGTTIKKVKVHDNTFIQCDFHGVHIEDGCMDVDVHDNDFDTCGAGTGTSGLGSGVYVAVTNATRLSKQIRVHDNNIIGAAGCDYGIYCGGSQTTKDVKVHHNTVDMAGAGIPIYFASMQQFDLSHNTAKNSSGVGMSVRSGYGTVTGNRCYDDQGSPTQTYGIEYNSNATYVIFKDNILTGNVTGAFSELSTPQGTRFGWNITGTDEIVSISCLSSTANSNGRYDLDGPVAYRKRKAVADADYSMTKYDAYIAYTSLSAGRQVTLADVTNLVTGHEVVIKDEAGAAGTYNITLVPAAGVIDGAASLVVSTDYGSVRLRSDGSNWFTV